VRRAWSGPGENGGRQIAKERARTNAWTKAKRKAKTRAKSRLERNGAARGQGLADIARHVIETHCTP
jgi:hypothetical protein